MALKLIDPVYNQMPFFQPNQVLTYNHLNDLASYLYQQERYTRNKLMGSGIVCGMSFTWKAVGSNAEVIIDEGCAITSAGYLLVFHQPVRNGQQIPYTHKRVFSRLNEIEPFNDSIESASTNGNGVVELITQDEYDSETIAVKSVLSDHDKNGKVLIMLFDLQALNVAKCLDESCDDKGKVFNFTPRPLLVPVSMIDSILDATADKPYHTQPGRGYKGKENILFDHNYLYLKSIFRNSNLASVTSISMLAELFKYPFGDDVLNAYKQTMDNLISKFPWIFQTQMNCMKLEVTALANQTLGTLFMSKVKAFRDATTNKNYVQYAYDFLRDVMDAYNEMLDSVSDLVGECGGNEHTNPFHVMLGKPQTNDTLACYREEKYKEHNFKYRHSFIPSPIMSGQYMLYEKTLNQFTCLARIIANFNVNKSDTTAKVISGKDYESPIGDRVIPFFYNQSAIESLQRVWNYNLTRRNKHGMIKGYQMPILQEDLLKLDTARTNFYRIEGHLGKMGVVAKTEIDAIRKAYNLPFEISTLSIQPETKSMTCSFPDLEEEYSYYRDRATGYLKEISRWLESLRVTLDKLRGALVNATNMQGNGKKDQVEILQKVFDYYDRLVEIINKMRELLKEPCLESFDYEGYKQVYLAIWNGLFELYFFVQKKKVGSARQELNSIINVANIILFRPIYKIQYMYKYRMAMLTQNDVASLKLISSTMSGVEHLAGVRRGETFLMVTDQSQGGIVVADFSLPGYQNCDCGCQVNPCDGTKKSLVAPLQKPIIMVVDVKNREEVGLTKKHAVFNKEYDSYELVLDEMGFYKGGSDIKKQVKITDNKGTEVKALTGIWEDEQLRLSCKEHDITDGAYELKYELGGDFDGSSVSGIIYLFVRGKVTDTKGTFEVAVDALKLERYAVFNETDDNAKDKVKISFDGDVVVRTIGRNSVDVYTTPNNNEVGVFYDKGKPYLKMITTKTPGVENIPVIITSGGASRKVEVVLNVVGKDIKMQKKEVSGIIADKEGNPIKDALIKFGDSEVITDAEGKYTLKNLKAGEVIKVEKDGFKIANIQASDSMESKINLQKENLINIPGLEAIKLPDLGSLTKGFNNFMNVTKKDEKP